MYKASNVKSLFVHSPLVTSLVTSVKLNQNWKPLARHMLNRDRSEILMEKPQRWSVNQWVFFDHIDILRSMLVKQHPKRARRWVCHWLVKMLPKNSSTMGANKWILKQSSTWVISTQGLSKNRVNRSNCKWCEEAQASQYSCSFDT